MKRKRPGGGRLQPGDQLPSVRRLASDLGINLHTVNKAYAVLRDEGYVAMRGRSGAVVADYQANTSSARREEGRCAIECSLRQLAVEFKAQGGEGHEFVELAARMAGSVFGDTVDWHEGAAHQAERGIL